MVATGPSSSVRCVQPRFSPIARFDLSVQPGAILSHDLTELTIRCKVNQIPEEIKVDFDSALWRYTAGHIALQSEGAPIEFRNVMLTPIER